MSDVTLTAVGLKTKATVDLTQSTIEYTKTDDAGYHISLDGTFSSDGDVFFCLIPGELTSLIVSAKVDDKDYSVLLPTSEVTSFVAGNTYTVTEAGLTEGHMVSANNLDATDMNNYNTLRVVGELSTADWSSLKTWARVDERETLDLSGITNTEITQSALSQGTFKTVLLPACLTRLGDQAFSACTSLTSITIPALVTELGSSVFMNSSSLAKVYCEPESVPKANIFYGTSASLVIYVPKASLSAYQAASNWSTYADKMKGM